MTLVALNLASWFAVAWFYHLPLLGAHSSSLILRAGALNGDLLWAGEWWRILTSQFLHVYFAHLIFNLAALLFLGAALESVFGSLRFALLYLISGSTGQLVAALAAPTLVASGASQAVMGIAGAAAVLLLRRRKSRAPLLIALLAVLSIQLGLDMIAAHTIKPGHWSGFLAGAVLGYAFTVRNQIRKRQI
ncbi:MAG TPA: rhomboid family intramembrane serine protease [Pyrinomonadaceae bacterium]|nr:rhomboid family intramembrane serine protease [Pyrinomonadaceae bacterium]